MILRKSGAGRRRSTKRRRREVGFKGLSRRFRGARVTIAVVVLVVTAAITPDARERLHALWRDMAPGGTSSGDALTGRAIVVDGDTIEIGATRVRLHGIDAPESAQTCRDATGGSWPCGREATRALTRMIDGRTVACEERDLDRYGRTVARCRLGERDINAWLVGQGLALAYRRYSRDYVGDEDEARAAGRGMWAGTFEAPWEWRIN